MKNYHYIFTKSITCKNGRVIYAHQYGLKAFYIKVKRRKDLVLT